MEAAFACLAFVGEGIFVGSMTLNVDADFWSFAGDTGLAYAAAFAGYSGFLAA